MYKTTMVSYWIVRSLSGMCYLLNYRDVIPFTLDHSAALLLARQYCLARWRLSSVGVVCRRLSVTLPAAGRVGGRAADTARQASTVTAVYRATPCLNISQLRGRADQCWSLLQLVSCKTTPVNWACSTCSETERCHWNHKHVSLSRQFNHRPPRPSLVDRTHRHPGGHLAGGRASHIRRIYRGRWHCKTRARPDCSRRQRNGNDDSREGKPRSQRRSCHGTHCWQSNRRTVAHTVNEISVNSRYECGQIGLYTYVLSDISTVSKQRRRHV